LNSLRNVAGKGPKRGVLGRHRPQSTTLDLPLAEHGGRKTLTSPYRSPPMALPNSLLLVIEPVLFINLIFCGRFWGKVGEFGRNRPKKRTLVTHLQQSTVAGRPFHYSY
jgi:hypothetical protein